MLLDTAGLLCYHHRDERQHAEAVEFFHAAPALTTHGYVLAEFVSLCQSRGLERSPALGFVCDLVADADVEVVSCVFSNDRPGRPEPLAGHARKYGTPDMRLFAAVRDETAGLEESRDAAVGVQ